MLAKRENVAVQKVSSSATTVGRATDSRRKAENPQSVGGVVCRLRPSRPRRINICLLYSIWFPLFYIEGLDPSRSPVWTLLEGRRLLERIDQSWPTFQLQHVKLVAAQQKKKRKEKGKKELGPPSSTCFHPAEPSTLAMNSANCSSSTEPACSAGRITRLCFVHTRRLFREKGATADQTSRVADERQEPRSSSAVLYRGYCIMLRFA